MFDKAKRDELRQWLAESHDAPEGFEAYVDALEKIAHAAKRYLDNSTYFNAVRLDAAPNKVDRMRA